MFWNLQLTVLCSRSAEDLVFGQYREPGVLMWRGYALQQFVDQCFSNIDGHTLGRQTPMHYGSKRLNYLTLASPLATQVPHVRVDPWWRTREKNS
jgi:2-oxoisovalerate dehydrogenase E1 component alpha subunit